MRVFKIVLSFGLVFWSFPCLTDDDFRRGDVNLDETVDLSDAIAFWWNSPDPPWFMPSTCRNAADVNDDNVVDLNDTITFLQYLFMGGTGPSDPGPDEPGPDPRPGGNLTCESYPHSPSPVLADVSLGFLGPPGISGNPGQVVTFEVDLTLTVANNSAPRGPQGWSIGLEVIGATIDPSTFVFVEDIGLPDSWGLHIEVLTIHDGDPDPVIHDLWTSSFIHFEAGYESEAWGRPDTDVPVGVVSAIVLGPYGSWAIPGRNKFLLSDGTQTIGRLLLQATIPEVDDGSSITLRYIDGLYGSGRPVRNIVTIESASQVPVLGTLTIPFGDCNGNGIRDDFDISAGTSADCDLNAIPDECDLVNRTAKDCNGNGVPDSCEIAGGTAKDCDGNGIPDSCDIAGGAAKDCDGNGIPDSCEVDCNGNGIPDRCDIASGQSGDCDGNGVPDSCEVDCNKNAIPDACEIASGAAKDCDGNGIPDDCDLEATFSLGPPVLSPTGIQDPAGGYWQCRLPQAAGDIDGDGNMDMAGTIFSFTQSSDVGIHISLSDGSGHLRTTPIQLFTGSDSYGLAALALSDLDGDGHIDVAVAAGSYSSSTGSVIVLLGDGAGIFEQMVRYSASVNPRYPNPGLLAIDLNADGRPELITGNYVDSTLSVFPNAGDGTFGSPTVRVNKSSPWYLHSGDLDGDGDVDVLTVCGSPAVLDVLLNNRDGSLGVPVEYSYPADGVGLLLADGDGDGDLDVLMKGNSKYYMLKNDGHASFAAPEEIAIPAGVGRLYQSCDLDGDGDQDLIAETKVLLRTRDGHFVIGPDIETGLSLVADFNGDGRPDLAFPMNGSPQNLAVRLNGSLPARSLDLNSNGIPDECDRPAFHRGDPNGDGTTDISDAIAVLSHLFLGGVAPSCKESADANDDGQVDISDGIAILNFLFLGGKSLAEPGPAPAPCGQDPDEPGSAGDLGCERYEGCASNG